MANVQDLFYHGIRQQIRRVLGKMTMDQIDQGLTAFEDGGRNWAQCFFARALQPERLSNERDVMRILNITTPVPVRIVYNLFDQMQGSLMTSAELRKFIEDVRDESRPDEVNELLKSLKTPLTHNANKEITFNEVTCG